VKRLIIATGNPGKIREIRQIYSDLSFQILSLDDISFKEKIRETGKSFAENAIIKAESVGKKVNELTLSEDSGLVIDALNGRPGIYSARYSPGTDTDRLKKVLKDLEGIPLGKRTARFIASVAIYNPDTLKTQTFIGISEGRITDVPIGDNGFGYDPIFYNLDLKKTNGQATDEEKNRVSHRARALTAAKKILLQLS
jgi:XTP/dITP diphosphohydrolase